MEISSGGCLSATSEEAPSSIFESQTRSSTWWRRRWCRRAADVGAPSRTNSRAKEEEEQAEVSGDTLLIGQYAVAFVCISLLKREYQHVWLWLLPNSADITSLTLKSIKALSWNNYKLDRYISHWSASPHSVGACPHHSSPSGAGSGLYWIISRVWFQPVALCCMSSAILLPVSCHSLSSPLQ